MRKFFPELSSTKWLLKEWFPEVCLILILSMGMLNPISLSLIALLVILIVTKNAVMGAVMGLLFLFSTVLIALAVYSEFKEFEFGFSEYRARKLVVGGGIVVGIIALLATKMTSKYFRKLNALSH